MLVVALVVPVASQSIVDVFDAHMQWQRRLIEAHGKVVVQNRCAIVFAAGHTGFASILRGWHCAAMAAIINRCFFFSEALVKGLDPQEIQLAIPELEPPQALDTVYMPQIMRWQDRCTTFYKHVRLHEHVRLQLDYEINQFTNGCEEGKRAANNVSGDVATLVDRYRRGGRATIEADDVQLFRHCFKPGGLSLEFIHAAKHAKALMKNRFGEYTALFLRVAGSSVRHQNTSLNTVPFADGGMRSPNVQHLLDNLNGCTAPEHAVFVASDSSLYRSLIVRKLDTFTWSCCTEPFHQTRATAHKKKYSVAQLFYDIEVAAGARRIVHLQGNFWRLARAWENAAHEPAEVVHLSMDMDSHALCNAIVGK